MMMARHRVGLPFVRMQGLSGVSISSDSRIATNTMDLIQTPFLLRPRLLPHVLHHLIQAPLRFVHINKKADTFYAISDPVF